MSENQNEQMTRERIYTRCPSCHNDTLIVNKNHLLCTWLECKDPLAIDKAEQTITTLTAELAALQKDKERLDWLATKASVTFVHYAVSGYVIATSRDGETKSHQMLSDDLRTAIDYAMKEKNV